MHKLSASRIIIRATGTSQHEWGTCFRATFSFLKGVIFTLKLTVFELYFSVSILVLHTLCAELHLKFLPTRIILNRFKVEPCHSRGECRPIVIIKLSTHTTDLWPVVRQPHTRATIHDYIRCANAAIPCGIDQAHLFYSYGTGVLGPQYSLKIWEIYRETGWVEILFVLFFEITLWPFV